MRDDTRAGIAGIAGFGLSLVFAIAGSLLIAPWVSLLAMAAVPVDRRFWDVRRIPWALVFGGLFLVWVALSYLWSPHDDPGQIWRTCLGIPLYILFAARIGARGHLPGAGHSRARRRAAPAIGRDANGGTR